MCRHFVTWHGSLQMSRTAPHHWIYPYYNDQVFLIDWPLLLTNDVMFVCACSKCEWLFIFSQTFIKPVRKNHIYYGTLTSVTLKMGQKSSNPSFNSLGKRFDSDSWHWKRSMRSNADGNSQPTVLVMVDKVLHLINNHHAETKDTILWVMRQWVSNW